MKILIHSGAPWAPTGYGNQTALFAPRIRDLGHEVAISSTWGLQGYTLKWDGITVFPADGNYGNSTLHHYADKFGADLIITLMDVWPLANPRLKTMNMAAWTPIDHNPCPPKVALFFQEMGARPIAMSRFGERMLRDEGLDPLYVPHGVDTNLFRPLSDDDRAAFRKMQGWPDGAFVVGMVANNTGHSPPRKAFPQAIQAFAAFQRTHPDAFLYFHSEMTGTRERGEYAGMNLLELCDQFEVAPESVSFTNQVDLEAGIPQEWMARLHASFDVLLNPSYGEGFGIPIIEAQATGTPVIVTEWTAMPELCGAGWSVLGEPYYQGGDGGRSFFMAPFTGDIIMALEAAHADAAGLRGQAREFALKYDADLITETYWKPALEVLSRPREVPPLPNREMRRARKKAGSAA